MAVGLRLGLDLCSPHECHCGSMVDARDFHSFVCKKAPGKTIRHHSLNDLIARIAFQQLAFPSSYLVPTGNVPMDFLSFPGKTVRRFAGM